MEVPPSFSSPSKERKVCWLKKALDGLKQSPRAWFDRFHKAMVKFGYRQSHLDLTIFVKVNHRLDENAECIVVNRYGPYEVTWPESLKLKIWVHSVTFFGLKLPDQVEAYFSPNESVFLIFCKRLVF